MERKVLVGEECRGSGVVAVVIVIRDGWGGGTEEAETRVKWWW